MALLFVNLILPKTRFSESCFAKINKDYFYISDICIPSKYNFKSDIFYMTYFTEFHAIIICLYSTKIAYLTVILLLLPSLDFLGDIFF